MFVSDCYNVNEKGHLTISGCDTVELAEKYGTALYVMSEDEIRSVCRRYKSSLSATIMETAPRCMPVRRSAAKRFAVS